MQTRRDLLLRGRRRARVGHRRVCQECAPGRAVSAAALPTSGKAKPGIRPLVARQGPGGSAGRACVRFIFASAHVFARAPECLRACALARACMCACMCARAWADASAQCHCRLIGVEAEGADAMARSLVAGERVYLKDISRFADSTSSAATSAPGLGPPLPHLHRDCAHPWPHLHRDSAHPSHICTGTGPTPGHICNGTGWPTVCRVCGRCQARTKRRARAQAQPPNITITTAQATALARFASASEDARMPSRLVAWHAA